MHKKNQTHIFIFPLIIYILHSDKSSALLLDVQYIFFTRHPLADNQLYWTSVTFQRKKIQVQFLFLYSDYSMYVLNYSCSFGIQRVYQPKSSSLVGWLHFRMVCEQEFLVPRRSFNALKILSFTTLRNFVFVSRKKRLDQYSDVKQSNQIKYR